MYNESGTYRFSSNYFSDDEAATVDTRFEGDGKHIIFALKKTNFRSYEYHCIMKADLRT